MNDMTRTHDPVTLELLAWIQQSVERLCRSAEGLTDDQARTPVVASGWTVAGLLNHVHESTCFWLGNVIAGNPMGFQDDDEPWDNDPRTPVAMMLDRIRDDVSQACSQVRGVASSEAPGWWPEGAWGGYRQDTVLGVLIHLLNDNSAHTGHMDLAREGIDGAVWDYRLGGVARPDVS